MDFTDSQVREIRCFFGAVASLSEHPKERFNRKLADRVLEKLVDHLRNSDIVENADLAEDQLQLFRFLEGVARRQRRYEKLLPAVIIAIAISATICFVAFGWLEAVVLLACMLLLGFGWSALMWRYYITRKFSSLTVGLTPTEIQFAIDSIIKGPGWS